MLMITHIKQNKDKWITVEDVKSFLNPTKSEMIQALTIKLNKAIDRELHDRTNLQLMDEKTKELQAEVNEGIKWFRGEPPFDGRPYQAERGSFIMGDAGQRLSKHLDDREHQRKILMCTRDRIKMILEVLELDHLKHHYGTEDDPKAIMSIEHLTK